MTITLSGDADATTTTIADGTYSFPGIALNGNYTVTPSKTDYTFSAISIGVIVSGADATGNNFTATANVATTYTISGAVTLGGVADAGVTITLSGGTSGTTITATATDGTYSFAGLLPGDYTVTPSKAGYTFSAALTPTIGSADVTGQNFTSTVVPSTFIYTISGTMSGDVGNGVMINLTGAATNHQLTSGGSYSFGSLANGVYTVTPVLSGHTFSPSSAAVTISGSSHTTINFAATVAAATYSISGTVSGQVVSGVTITLSGVAGAGTTTTNATGNYSFSGLVAGSYTVMPTAGMGSYTSVPGSLSPTISTANVTGQNFVVGTAPAAWSQDDLTGTWRMNMLKTGTSTEWDRARISFNSSGVGTCLSVDGSFTGGNVCPSPFDLKLTMNTLTGVITQTGTHAPNAGTDHMTMTSNKNFIAGTGTNGTTPNFSYQLMIAQKEVTGTVYSNADVHSKSFVYHQLRVGVDNTWMRGEGNTDATGAITMTSETDPSGTDTPGDVGATMSVDGNGVVTMSPGMATFQGFLSADKKTIVGTHGHSGETEGDRGFHLMIIQITGTEFTVGAMPAGISVAHMLGTGTDFAGWIHFTNTVAPGGGMSFSYWADSGFGSSAPVGTDTGSITASGTLTITGNPTYHGQISHDGKFTVGTQTVNGSYYFLNVTTQ